MKKSNKKITEKEKLEILGNKTKKKLKKTAQAISPFMVLGLVSICK